MADLGGGSLLQQLSTQQNTFNQALQRYPVLNGIGLTPQFSPGKGGGNKLEFWPPGEPGAPDRPRPSSIPPNAPGVEIYDPSVRPIDVLGDAVSHHLMKTDPKIKAYYDKFKNSLNEDQRSRLQEQYDYAKKNEAENRPFAEWAEVAGIPAYFRGYAFDQWPADFNQQAYTPQQRAMFDEMMAHLSGPQK